MENQEEILAEIWADDLLSRRKEADVVAAYIESVAARRTAREDVHSFSLAIDVGYGEGKTFFLRRLARQLQLKHPVAYVDAWADDIANEPLTALVATLKAALDPLKAEPSVEDKFSAVLSKTGAVLRAVTVGALRRGAAALVTEAAVQASTKILAEGPEIIQKVAKAALDADDVIDDTVDSFRGVATNATMRDRIEEFEATKSAVSELKQSLTELVAELESKRLRPPIVIIVDELDRCRPTYAVKLLEEIKHLFDVPGLVFVLGMHGEQLSHSISVAYGSMFDSKAYLRRFIARRYKLKQPDMRPLLEKLLKSAGITKKQIEPLFSVRYVQMNEEAPELDKFVALYMHIYKLPVRESFHVVDALQTCVALSEQALYGPYLLPMLMSKIGGAGTGEISAPAINNSDWVFPVQDHRERRVLTYTPWELARQLQTQFNLGPRDFTAAINSENHDYVVEIAAHMKNGTRGYSDPSNYPQLLDAVGRFETDRKD